MSVEKNPIDGKLFQPENKYDYFSYFSSNDGVKSIDRANADLYQHLNQNPLTELFLPTLEQVKKGSKKRAEELGVPYNEKSVTDLWQKANSGYRKYSQSEFSANNNSLVIPDSYINRKNGFKVNVGNIDMRPESIKDTGLEWRNAGAVEDGTTPYNTVIESEFKQDTNSGLYAKVEDYYEVAKKNAAKQKKRGVYDEKTGDLKYNEDGTPVLEDYHPDDLGWNTARTYRFDKNTGQPILVPLDKGEDSRKVVNKKSAWGVSDFNSTAGGMFDVPLDIASDAIAGLSKATGYVIDNSFFTGDSWLGAAWDNKGTSQSKLGKAFTDFGYNIQSNKNLDQQGGAFDSMANFTSAYSGFMASFIPQVALTAVNPMLGLGYAGATTAEGMYETALQSGFTEKESAVAGAAMSLVATGLSKVMSGDWMNRITKSINPKWMQDKVFKKVVEDSLKAKDLYAKQVGRELTEQEAAKVIGDAATKSAKFSLGKLVNVVEDIGKKWKAIPESAWMAKTAQQGIDEAIEETTEELIQEGLQATYRDYFFDNTIYKKYNEIFDGFVTNNEREERFIKSMSDGTNAFSKKSWKEIFDNAADTFGISAIGTASTTGYRNFKLRNREKAIQNQDNAIIDYILQNPNGKDDLIKTGEELKNKGVLGNTRYTKDESLATQEDKTDTENYANFKTSKDKIEAYYDLYEKSGIKDALSKNQLTSDQAKSYLNELGNGSNPQGAALYNFGELKRTEEQLKGIQSQDTNKDLFSQSNLDLFNKSYEDRNKEIESRIAGKDSSTLATTEKQLLYDKQVDDEILKSNNLEATVLKSGYGKLYRLQKEKQELENELDTINPESSYERTVEIENRLNQLNDVITKTKTQVSSEYATNHSTYEKLSNIADLLLKQNTLKSKVKSIYNGDLLKNQIQQGAVLSKINPSRLFENFKNIDEWEKIASSLGDVKEQEWIKNNLLLDANSWEKVNTKKLSQFNSKRKKSIGEYKTTTLQKGEFVGQVNAKLKDFKVEDRTLDDVLLEGNELLKSLLVNAPKSTSKKNFVDELTALKDTSESNFIEKIFDAVPEYKEYDDVTIDDFNETNVPQELQEDYSKIVELNKLIKAVDKVQPNDEDTKTEIDDTDAELKGSIQLKGNSELSPEGLSNTVDLFFAQAQAKDSSIEQLPNDIIKSWEDAVIESRFMANLNFGLNNELLKEAKIESKNELKELSEKAHAAILEKLKEIEVKINTIKSIKQDLGKDRFKEDDEIRIETIKKKANHIANSILDVLKKSMASAKIDGVNARRVFDDDAKTVNLIEELSNKLDLLDNTIKGATDKNGIKTATVEYVDLENFLYNSFTDKEVQALYVEILEQYKDKATESYKTDKGKTKNGHIQKDIYYAFLNGLNNDINTTEHETPLLQNFTTLETIFKNQTKEFYKDYNKKYLVNTTDNYLPSLEQEGVLKQVYSFVNSNRDNFAKVKDNIKDKQTQGWFDEKRNNNLLFVTGMAGSGKTQMITKILSLVNSNNVVISAPNENQKTNLNKVVDKYNVNQKLLSIEELINALTNKDKSIINSELMIIDEGTILNAEQANSLSKALIKFNTNNQSKVKLIVLGDETQLVGFGESGGRRFNGHPFTNNVEVIKLYTDELQQTYRTSFLTFNLLQQALIGGIRLSNKNKSNKLPTKINGIEYYSNPANLSDNAGIEYQNQVEQEKQFFTHLEQAVKTNTVSDLMYIVSTDEQVKSLITQIRNKHSEQDIDNATLVNLVKTVDNSQGSQRKFIYANVTEGLTDPSTTVYLRAVRVATTRAIDYVSLVTNGGEQSNQRLEKKELFKYADEETEPNIERREQLKKLRGERNKFIKDIVSSIAGKYGLDTEINPPDENEGEKKAETETQEDTDTNAEVKTPTEENIEFANTVTETGGSTAESTIETLNAVKENLKAQGNAKGEIEKIEATITNVKENGIVVKENIVSKYDAVRTIDVETLTTNFTPDDKVGSFTNITINHGKDSTVELIVNFNKPEILEFIAPSTGNSYTPEQVIKMIQFLIINPKPTVNQNLYYVTQSQGKLTNDKAIQQVESEEINKINQEVEVFKDKVTALINESKEVINDEDVYSADKIVEIDNIKGKIESLVASRTSDVELLKQEKEKLQDEIDNLITKKEQLIKNISDSYSELNKGEKGTGINIIDMLNEAVNDGKSKIEGNFKIDGTVDEQIEYELSGLSEDQKEKEQQVSIKLEPIGKNENKIDYLKRVIGEFRKLYQTYLKKISLANANAIVSKFLEQNSLILHSHALSKDYVNEIATTLNLSPEQAELEAIKTKNQYIHKMFLVDKPNFNLVPEHFKGVTISRYEKNNEDKLVEIPIPYKGDGTFRLVYKKEHPHTIIYDNDVSKEDEFAKSVYVVEYNEVDMPAIELGVVRKNKGAGNEGQIFNQSSLTRIQTDKNFDQELFDNFNKALNSAKQVNGLEFRKLAIKDFKNPSYSSEGESDTAFNLTDYKKHLEDKNYGYSSLYQIRASQVDTLRIPNSDYNYGSGKGNDKGIAGATVMFIGHGVSGVELDGYINKVVNIKGATDEQIQLELNSLMNTKNISMVILNKTNLSFEDYKTVSQLLVKQRAGDKTLTELKGNVESEETIFDYLLAREKSDENVYLNNIFDYKPEIKVDEKGNIEDSLIDKSFFSYYQALQTDVSKVDANKATATSKNNLFGLVNKLFNIFTNNNLNGSTALFDVSGYIISFKDSENQTNKIKVRIETDGATEINQEWIIANADKYNLPKNSGAFHYAQELYSLTPSGKKLLKQKNPDTWEQDTLHLTTIFNDFALRRNKRDVEGKQIGYYGEVNPDKDKGFKRDFNPKYRYDLIHYLDTLLGTEAATMWKADDISSKNYTIDEQTRGKIHNSIRLDTLEKHQKPFVKIPFQTDKDGDNEIATVLDRIYRSKSLSKPYPTFLVDVNSLVPEKDKTKPAPKKEPVKTQAKPEVNTPTKVEVESPAVIQPSIQELQDELAAITSAKKVRINAITKENEGKSNDEIKKAVINDEEFADLNKRVKQIDKILNPDKYVEISLNINTGNPNFVTNKLDATNRLRNLFGTNSLQINYDNEQLQKDLQAGIITQAEYDFHSNPDKVLGYVYKNVIALNEFNGMVDSETVSHEAVHYVLKTVSPQFRRNVINEARVKFNMPTQTEKEVEEKLAQWYGKVYPTYQETNASILRGLPLAIRRLYVGMREMYLNIKKLFINDSNYVNELFNTMESGIYRDFDVKEFNDDVVIDTALNNKGKRIKAYQSLYKVFSGDGTSNEINLEIANLMQRRKLYESQYGISDDFQLDLSEAINKLKEDRLEEYKEVIDKVREEAKQLHIDTFGENPADEELEEDTQTALGRLNINDDYEKADARLHLLFTPVKVELEEGVIEEIIPFDTIVLYNYPTVSNEGLYSDNELTKEGDVEVKGREFHLLDRNKEATESDILIQHLVNTPLYIKETTGQGKNAKEVWKKTNAYVDLMQAKSVLNEVFKKAKSSTTNIDPTYDDLLKSFKEVVNNTAFRRGSTAFSLFVKFFADSDFINNTIGNTNHSFYSVTVENSLGKQGVNKIVNDSYKEKLSNVLSELYSFYGSTVKRLALNLDIKEGINEEGRSSSMYADLKAITKGKLINYLYTNENGLTPKKSSIADLQKAGIKIINKPIVSNISGTKDAYYLTYNNTLIIQLEIINKATQTNNEVKEDKSSYTIKGTLIPEILTNEKLPNYLTDMLHKLGVTLPLDLIKEAVQKKDSNYNTTIGKVLGFSYTQYIADLISEYGAESSSLYDSLGTLNNLINNANVIYLKENIAFEEDEVNEKNNRRSPVMEYQDIERLASLYEQVIPKMEKEFTKTADGDTKHLNLDNNTQHKAQSLLFKIKSKFFSKEVTNLTDEETNVKVIANSFYTNPLLTGEIDFDEDSIKELNVIENPETKEKMQIVDASVFEQAKIYLEELFAKPLIASKGKSYYSQTIPKSDKATQFVKQIKGDTILVKYNDDVRLAEKVGKIVDSDLNYFYNQFLPRVENFAKLLVKNQIDATLYKEVTKLRLKNMSILTEKQLSTFETLLSKLAKDNKRLLEKSDIKIGFDIAKDYSLHKNIKGIFNGKTKSEIVVNKINTLRDTIQKDAREIVKSGYNFIGADIIEKLVEKKLYTTNEFADLAAFSKKNPQEVVGYNLKRNVLKPAIIDGVETQVPTEVMNPLLLDFLTSSVINGYFIDEAYHGHQFNYKDLIDEIKRAIFLSTNYKTPDLNNPNGLGKFSNIVTIQEPLMVDNIYEDRLRYKATKKMNNVETGQKELIEIPIKKSNAPLQVKTIVESLTNEDVDKITNKIENTKILDGLGFMTPLQDILEQNSYGNKFSDNSQRKNIAGGLFNPKLIKNSYSKLTNEFLELGNEYVYNYVEKALGGVNSPLFQKWNELGRDWSKLTDWFNAINPQTGKQNKFNVVIPNQVIEFDGVTITEPAKTIEDLHTGLIIYPSSSKISPNKINDETDQDWNRDKIDNRMGGFVISLYQSPVESDIAMITQENYIFSLLGKNYQTTQEIYDTIGSLAEQGLITLDKKSGSFILPENESEKAAAIKSTKEKWFKDKLADILRNMGNISNTLLFASNDIDSSHPLLRNSMYGAVASAIKSFTVKQRFKGFRGTVSNSTGLVNMYNVEVNGKIERMSKKELVRRKFAKLNDRYELEFKEGVNIEVDELAFTRVTEIATGKLLDDKQVKEFIKHLKNYELNAESKKIVDDTKDLYRVEPMEIMVSRKALAQFRIPEKATFGEINNLDWFINKYQAKLKGDKFDLSIIDEMSGSNDKDLYSFVKTLNDYAMKNNLDYITKDELTLLLPEKTVDKIYKTYISTSDSLSENLQNKISEKLNIPKESLTTENVIEWANLEAVEEFELWKQAIQPKLTRIPVTGYNSVQMTKIVEFYDSQDNTVLVPSELTLIAGSDNDGDMVTLEFYDTNKKDTPEKAIRRTMFNAKKRALLDPFNIRTLFSPINFDKLKERKQALQQKQSDSYKMSFNSPVSKMIVQKNNNDGKAGVGIFVKLSEVYYNMYRIAKTLKDSGVVDADKFNQPIYFNGKVYDSILGGAKKKLASEDSIAVEGYMKSMIKEFKEYIKYNKFTTENKERIKILTQLFNTAPDEVLSVQNKVLENQLIAENPVITKEFAKETVKEYKSLAEKLFAKSVKINGIKAANEQEYSKLSAVAKQLYSSLIKDDLTTKNNLSNYTDENLTKNIELFNYLIKNATFTEEVIDGYTSTVASFPILKQKLIEEFNTDEILTPEEKIAYIEKVNTLQPIAGYRLQNGEYYREELILVNKILENYSNASLDNAKEALLGWLNVNEKTWNLFGGAIVAQIDEEDMTNLMTHPYTLSLVKSLDTENSIYSNNDKKSTLNSILERKLFMSDKDFKKKIEGEKDEDELTESWKINLLTPQQVRAYKKAYLEKKEKLRNKLIDNFLIEKQISHEDFYKKVKDQANAVIGENMRVPYEGFSIVDDPDFLKDKVYGKKIKSMMNYFLRQELKNIGWSEEFHFEEIDEAKTIEEESTTYDTIEQFLIENKDVVYDLSKPLEKILDTDSLLERELKTNENQKVKKYVYSMLYVLNTLGNEVQSVNGLLRTLQGTSGNEYNNIQLLQRTLSILGYADEDTPLDAQVKQLETQLLDEKLEEKFTEAIKKEKSKIISPRKLVVYNNFVKQAIKGIIYDYKVKKGMFIHKLPQVSETFDKIRNKVDTVYGKFNTEGAYKSLEKEFDKFLIAKFLGSYTNSLPEVQGFKWLNELRKLDLSKTNHRYKFIKYLPKFLEEIKNSDNKLKNDKFVVENIQTDSLDNMITLELSNATALTPETKNLINVRYNNLSSYGALGQAFKQALFLQTLITKTHNLGKGSFAEVMSVDVNQDYSNFLIKQLEDYKRKDSTLDTDLNLFEEQYYLFNPDKTYSAKHNVPNKSGEGSKIRAQLYIDYENQIMNNVPVDKFLEGVYTNSREKIKNDLPKFINYTYIKKFEEKNRYVNVLYKLNDDNSAYNRVFSASLKSINSYTTKPDNIALSLYPIYHTIEFEETADLEGVQAKIKEINEYATANNLTGKKEIMFTGGVKLNITNEIDNTDLDNKLVELGLVKFKCNN